jgi:subtilisin family serine protease
MQSLAVSKWMNTFTVYCPDSTVVPQILNLPFVDSIMAVGAYILNDIPSTQIPEIQPSIVQNTLAPAKDSLDYGYGFGQIAFHNGHLLHEAGFHGEGMLIAVIDGGFYGIETISFFQDMVNEGRFYGHYSLMPNFVDTLESGWSEVHGTIVTSTIAANTSGELIGTAPAASYALIHTEWVGSEELVEEDFWANGAEIADSIGADVINSSLGYRAFPDFPQSDVTYADMDGVNSIASRCATILGQKGVIVCIAAGNDGSNEYYYVGRPGDAFDILCVGASAVDSIIADFSSHGPSYDGRVKPDITSVGVETSCYYPGDWLSTANGTSLATPVATGLCACLWQAMPQYTSTEMMQIIRESSHLYNNPNTEYGYGIPDFYKAYTTHVGINNYKPLQLSVYPNPVNDKLYLTNLDGNIQFISIYNAAGQLILQHTVNGNPLIEINVTSLPKGFYVGTATMGGNRTATFKFVK